jgi:CRP-like cAMP-binding protein
MFVPQFFFEHHFSEYIDIVEKHSTCTKDIPKGTVLRNTQTENRTSYYIKSGIAALTMTNESGYERILFFMCEGSIYPINTFKTLLSMDSYLNFVALTDLEVLTFPSEKILDMIEDNIDIAAATIKHYVIYTNILLCKLLLDSYNDSTKCICSFLYLYKNYYKSSNTINLTQEQIGQLLGLSRTQVARVFSELRKEKIIKTSRNDVVILDSERLKESCSDIVNE